MAVELIYPDTDYPKMAAKIFAKGKISKDNQNEFRLSMSHNGLKYYFSIFDSKVDNYRILEIHYEDDQWTSPANFHLTTKGDLEPFISSDGNRFYFSSNRKPAIDRQDSNIWKMNKENNVWQKPELLALNSNDSEWVASETLSGNIYFARFDQDDNANIMHYKNSISSVVPVINEANSSEYEPYIDPQERFIIFSSNRKSTKPENKAIVNLYISINENGKWQKPLKMGEAINNGKSVYSPLVSPDYKFLFFNRQGDIYWIDFKLSLKSLGLKLENIIK